VAPVPALLGALVNSVEQGAPLPLELTQPAMMSASVSISACGTVPALHTARRA